MIRQALLVLIFLQTSLAFAAESLYLPFEASGTFVKNHDGDTLTLDVPDRGQMTIRLSGADTPETGQAHWKKARDHLKQLLRGTPTTVWRYKKDRYDRDVCHVFVGETDVGLELIRGGYAWFASPFAKELTASQQASYPDAERQSREHRMGLWELDDPMPPWECRKLRRAGQKCR